MKLNSQLTQYLKINKKKVKLVKPVNKSMKFIKFNNIDFSEFFYYYVRKK
jgi:hypothetical protein